MGMVWFSLLVINKHGCTMHSAQVYINVGIIITLTTCLWAYWSHSDGASVIKETTSMRMKRLKFIVLPF